VTPGMRRIMSPVVVVIEAFDLPGLRCRPDAASRWRENVHVGLCTRTMGAAQITLVPPRPWAVTDLVAGDAESARWELDIAVRRHQSDLDFGGPFVRGKLGDRHIGLAWGEVPNDGTFRLFRGAKLRLDAIEPALIDQASRAGTHLVGRIGLTDANGNPRCASVRPPNIAWSTAGTAADDRRTAVSGREA
jgi:Family of unknown function (DUF5990)